MSIRDFAPLAIILLLLSCGCQSARIVSKSDTEGVIAIPANSNSWPFHYRAKAEELLSRECPEGYEIVLEEEFVTGQSTTTDESDENRTQQITKNASVSFDTSRTTSTTSNVTEWRIHYRKKSDTSQSEE